jgi:hypothetical protein
MEVNLKPAFVGFCLRYNINILDKNKKSKKMLCNNSFNQNSFLVE